MSDIKSKDNLVALVRGPVVCSNRSLNNEAVPVLGLAYIAGYLRKKGYKVVLIDSTVEGLNSLFEFKEYPGFRGQGIKHEETISMIPKDAKVIAFSGMFSGEWPVLRDLITLTRQTFPEALLVAGGEHITALTEYSLRDCPALDVCVRGEGEHTFYELVEAYSEIGIFSSVPGVAYLNKEGEYQQNGTNTPRVSNIEEIPWPYWPDNYLEKFWKAGKSYGVATERDMPFIMSRGCPYQCTFCSNLLMWNTLYKFRDLDDAMEEIKYYIKRYRITSLQLYDLTAIIKKKWIMDFCQRMLDEGIKVKWSLPSGTRSEVLDKDVLMMLKKTNCNYIVYAPESGSPKTLKKIKKRVKLERLIKSLIEAKRQGLIVRTNTIIGFPHETWGDIFETILFQMRNAIRGIDDVTIYIFSPYPGTEIFDELIGEGKIMLNDDYFFKLTSLNGDYLTTDIPVVNDNINGRVLVVVRLVSVLINYAISYLLYPKRIIRFIRNIYSGNDASTVFEHRVKDFLKRQKRPPTTTT